MYLNGEPLAQIDAGSPETILYLHTDHLLTARYATNAGGSTVWSWDSGAFGKEAPTGSATVNLRFPGQYFDAETGLHYNWHRYYDPTTGRYITSDLLGLVAGLNTYGYAGQNPLSFVDWNGQFLDVGTAITILVAVITIYAIANILADYFSNAMKPGIKPSDLVEPAFCAALNIGLELADPSKLFNLAKDSYKLLRSVANHGDEVTDVTKLFNEADDVAGGGLSKTPKPPSTRPLNAEDLGLKGSLQKLRGTFSVENGVATVRIDEIVGEVLNPFEIIENLIRLAKSEGAKVLKIEGILANERLLEIIKKRYGATTVDGGVDIIVIEL